jgi:hypothetical protein
MYSAIVKATRPASGASESPAEGAAAVPSEGAGQSSCCCGGNCG